MLESKRKALIFLLLAIILAATSGYLILQKVQSLNEDLGTFVTVYVADRGIDSRKLITAEDVRTEQIPQRYVRDEYITTEQELYNQVSLIPLTNGDIITDKMLTDKSVIHDSNSRVITLIPSNKIYFDEAVGANDRVDILVSHSFDGEPVTEIFMEDVNVVSSRIDENRLTAAGVEIPFDRVAELVHLQNYADSLRVVRANVGKNEQVSQPQQESEPEETSEDAAEENQDEQNSSENQEESNQEETEQEESDEE